MLSPSSFRISTVNSAHILKCGDPINPSTSGIACDGQCQGFTEEFS